MSITLDGIYNGDGGNEHRVFIKYSRFGWKAILADPNRHLSNGVTQYDYVETSGQKLGGRARRVLGNSFGQVGPHERRQP